MQRAALTTLNQCCGVGRLHSSMVKENEKNSQVWRDIGYEVIRCRSVLLCGPTDGFHSELNNHNDRCHCSRGRPIPNRLSPRSLKRKLIHRRPTARLNLALNRRRTCAINSRILKNRARIRFCLIVRRYYNETRPPIVRIDGLLFAGEPRHLPNHGEGNRESSRSPLRDYGTVTATRIRGYMTKSRNLPKISPDTVSARKTGDKATF